jgi:hypothetical protein
LPFQRKVLAVKRKLELVAVVLLSTVGAFGQRSQFEARFPLYGTDKACACVRTKNNTATASATETRIARSVYQVFWSRGNPRRELFRVKVGSYANEELVKLWNYGVVDEADFNGDGVPDYSWYGGDDTRQEMYLFLSGAEGQYSQVDVLKTVQGAWARRFENKAPDFGEVGSTYALANIALIRSSDGMALFAKVQRSMPNGATKANYDFLIRQADFKTASRE